MISHEVFMKTAKPGQVYEAHYGDEHTYALIKICEYKEGDGITVWGVADKHTKCPLKGWSPLVVLTARHRYKLVGKIYPQRKSLTI